MSKKIIFIITSLGIIAVFSFVLVAATSASHSWGPYHWARAVNPFAIKLGDNVSSVWDGYLVEASSDWSQSNVLDAVVVAGGSRSKNCRPTLGKIEVCNSSYGNTGWLGLAQIWINSSNHIVQAVAKMNDTYFNTATYNTPAWRRLVMCQEVAHGFGLDHQDENFFNLNLGSCMDYTNNPAGPPSNEHPDQHDHDQLASIYSHLDSSTTVLQSSLFKNGSLLNQGPNADNGGDNFSEQKDWGGVVRKGHNGRPSLYKKDLGGGHKLFTFVIWAD